ncbi:MAG: hypothetical protein ACTSU9_09315, partial [Promethearchaeota archaeon]
MEDTGVLHLTVPNFNDAILKVVFFHIRQSVPILTYDFQETTYNFDEQLLSGMISAILTVSEEIDQEHKSTLRRIDQTRYNIILEMGESVGIVLFTLKRENEKIIRELAVYLLNEFERNYGKEIEERGIEICFEQNMFDDFRETIKRTAMVPITISSAVLSDIQELTGQYPDANIILCDKLIFTPIYKYFIEYMTPNEIMSIISFLRNVYIDSTTFLEHMRKFGELETMTLTTGKRKIFVSDLGPFYSIIIKRTGRGVTDEVIKELMQELYKLVSKNTLILRTKERTILFQLLEFLREVIPGIDIKIMYGKLIKGINKFQRETNINFRKMDETYSIEKRIEIF